VVNGFIGLIGGFVYQCAGGKEMQRLQALRKQEIGGHHHAHNTFLLATLMFKSWVVVG
jgi:hypothetical protein